jgi:hypothetical protein
MSTLVEQKTHILYGVIIVVIASVAYHLISAKPKEIIKTQIETKVVNNDVVKTQTVFVDRVITTKKTNGDIITEVDHSHITDEFIDKTSSKDTISKTEVIKFLSSYSIDVMYPLTLKDITNPILNPLDTQLLLGVRVFDFPVFVTAGTNLHLNQVIVGLRIEL